MLQGTVTLPPSKSISNRALLLSAMSRPATENSIQQISNLSECDDTTVMAAALQRGQTADRQQIIDVGGAGTAMRFLTAYFAAKKGNDIVLTGNMRMRQRPIGPLVEALRSLGAEITYLDKEGYPPLHIQGQILHGDEATIDGSISSQFTSALLMVMGQRGVDDERQAIDIFRLHLEGHIASRPYIDMTIALMKHYGIDAMWEDDHTIAVQRGTYQNRPLTVEGDWTAASYWCALIDIAACMHIPCDIHLEGLSTHSIQGDSICVDMLDPRRIMRGEMSVDCANYPDLVQTLAVAYCFMDVPFHIYGAESLRVKETNRIDALTNELERLGYLVKVRTSEWRGHEEVTLIWDGTKERYGNEKSSLPTVRTYGDHRMAMAFALAVLAKGEIRIEDPNVVSKSYPSFWDDLRNVGITVEEVS